MISQPARSQTIKASQCNIWKQYHAVVMTFYSNRIKQVIEQEVRLV